MSEDFYHDDPVEEKSTRRFKGNFLTSAVVIIASAFFFQSTLASNISINSSAGIEFGQGVSVTAACSGATDLTMTPKTAFVNGSNNDGTHYLSSITLSGIPDNCKGADFVFSAYDSATTTALPIFGTTKTVARIWNNNGTFQGGSGYSGSTITSGSGTFTVTFTAPVALANNVAKITLQSSSHAALNCVLDGVCSVGDTGPGGGTVYFVSANAFSAPGSACNTDCHYLEVAKKKWDGTNDADSKAMMLSSTATPIPAQDQGTTFGAQVGTYRGTTEKNNWFIGQGFINTKLIAEISGNTTANSMASYARAFAPAGYTSTVGQWFIPSFNELNELCKYANGQTTGVTSVQCMGNTPFLTASTTTSEGFKGSNNYFSSSVGGSGSASIMYFGNGESNHGASLYNDTRNFRPVRVF